VCDSHCEGAPHNAVQRCAGHHAFVRYLKLTWITFGTVAKAGIVNRSAVADFNVGVLAVLMTLAIAGVVITPIWHNYVRLVTLGLIEWVSSLSCKRSPACSARLLAMMRSFEQRNERVSHNC
jgi:hypothetical protein